MNFGRKNKKEDFNEKILEIILETMKDKLNESSKEKCKINIENTKKGTLVSVEGKTVTILSTLAGATKKILNDLDTPKEVFDMLYDASQLVEVNPQGENNEK